MLLFIALVYALSKLVQAGLQPVDPFSLSNATELHPRLVSSWPVPPGGYVTLQGDILLLITWLGQLERSRLAAAVAGEDPAWTVTLPDGVSVGAVTFVVPADGGGRIVTHEPGTLTAVLDGASGRELRRYHVQGEAVGVTSTAVAYDEGGVVTLRSLDDHMQVTTLSTGGGGEKFSVCEEPGSGLVAVVQREPSTLSIFSHTGTLLTTTMLSEEPSGSRAVVSVDPDHLAVIEFPRTIRLFSWATGELTHTITGQDLGLMPGHMIFTMSAEEAPYGSGMMLHMWVYGHGSKVLSYRLE